MTSALRAIANRFPRAKAVAQAVLARFRGRSVSSNYVEIGSAEVDAEAARLRGAWQSTELPGRQRELVERQLAAFRRGESVDVFAVMLQSLADLGISGTASVLEIGCSSGYYSEIVAAAGPGYSYSGCDYSPAFVEMARQSYPGLRFDVEDAAALRYPTGAFDIAISGCCLLHIPEYEAAIAETARVARHFAIFHRTPVVIGQPTKVYRKLAYGVETVEIHLNEPGFLALLADNGFEIFATHTLSETIVDGVGDATRTYVCRKTAP